VSERPTDRLVWIDCEMTGLELGHDLLIEVAALVTDGELNVLDEGVDVVIGAGEEQLAAMVPVVHDMHASSGLTQEVLASTVTVAEAEQAVLAYIRKHVPEAGKAPLCGNTIATDRGFLARDMPELDGWLHYRMVDVSSVKELARRWYPRAYYNSPKKGGGHRALADIRESVLELAYYRSVVFVAPPGPSSDEASAAAARLLAAAAPADGASRLPEPAEQVPD
jgi:oligoribonuclease